MARHQFDCRSGRQAIRDQVEIGGGVAEVLAAIRWEFGRAAIVANDTVVDCVSGHSLEQKERRHPCERCNT